MPKLLPEPVGSNSIELFLYDMFNIDNDFVLRGRFSASHGFTNLDGEIVRPTHWLKYPNENPGWPIRYWVGGDGGYINGRRNFLEGKVHYDISSGEWWKKLTHPWAFRQTLAPAEWTHEAYPAFLEEGYSYPLWVELENRMIHAARCARLHNDDICVDSRCGLILDNIRRWKPRQLEDDWPVIPGGFVD